MDNATGTTGTKITYVKGESVFSSGDIGRHLFVVLAGAVELRAADGSTEIIGTGGIFGERTVMETVRHAHRATALAECTLLAIDQSQFLAIVAASPNFALKVMRAQAARTPERLAAAS
jgi:CRP-like cAMP-binding protein